MEKQHLISPTFCTVDNDTVIQWKKISINCIYMETMNVLITWMWEFSPLD